MGGHGGFISARHLEQAADYPEAEADSDPVVEPYIVSSLGIDHHDYDYSTH